MRTALARRASRPAATVKTPSLRNIGTSSLHAVPHFSSCAINEAVVAVLRHWQAATDCDGVRRRTMLISGEGGGRPMEFGMFHEFQRLPGASEPSAFADSFAQIDAAEQLGLDAMWLA